MHVPRRVRYDWNPARQAALLLVVLVLLSVIIANRAVLDAQFGGADLDACNVRPALTGDAFVEYLLTNENRLRPTLRRYDELLARARDIGPDPIADHFSEPMSQEPATTHHAASPADPAAPATEPVHK